MSNKPNSIAVLTSGGDAPGMNAAVRAVVRSAINKNILLKVTGYKTIFTKCHILYVASESHCIWELSLRLNFFVSFIQFISFFEVIFYHLFHLLVGYFAHIISELFKKGSPLVFANLELYPFTPLSLGMKSLLSQKNFFW